MLIASSEAASFFLLFTSVSWPSIRKKGTSAPTVLRRLLVQDGRRFSNPEGTRELT